MDDKIEIFISYADEDQEYLKDLESQLAPMTETYPIAIWHKREVVPGQEQQREIDKHLKAARIILLLVSPSYLASKYLYNHEVQRAMEYYKAGTAKVIPVLLRSIYWEDASFGKLEPLPANRSPVRQWRDRDEAFQNIAMGIRKIVKDLVAQSQPYPLPATTVAEKSPPEEIVMPNQLTPQEQPAYDVFLCHNSADKPAVREIANQLLTRGLRPWLDERELRPGLLWQPELEKQIKNIKSAAVFIGKSGRGPWQNLEIQGFLREFVKRQCPIIPVILADGKGDPDVPLFLGNMTWIDFRQKGTDPMERLVWGITGKNPHYQTSGGSQQPRGQVTTHMLAGSTDGQRQRLLQERDEKQKLWNLWNEKVQRLKEALAIETDVSVQFKYEKQLDQAEANLALLTKRLEEIKQALQ